MNIGIIGAGAIAQFLLKEINANKAMNAEVQSMFVRNRNKYRKHEQHYGVELYEDLYQFLASDIDIVVEAANVQAVKTLLPSILPVKDVVLISIGALADAAFYQKIRNLANTHGRKIHLPSGAIGGLDLLQNAYADGNVTNVSLTTRKPYRTLVADADEASSIETIVFEGSASEAIEQFPKNINVSIILSLAGLGVHDTNVTLIADPATDNNTHTIDIEGDFGTASLTVTNNPLPENPKTSHLAAMSILGTLQRLNQSIHFGL